MSQPSKKQKKATTQKVTKMSLRQEVLLNDARKFIEVWLEGNECTDFFNKVIKRDDIEFMPTKADLNPEAYEGEDAEEDGDEPIDVDNPVYWHMIRHMNTESHNWKALHCALMKTHKFPWHTAGGSCFFGFVGNCGWAEGYAGDPDFQTLINYFQNQ